MLASEACREDQVTDIEKLKSLLTEFGVPFYLNGGRVMVEKVPHDDSSKVVGYRGFSCVFEFENDGKFISMGIWEIWE